MISLFSKNGTTAYDTKTELDSILTQPLITVLFDIKENIYG